jgi:ABC-type phosphate transport system auxiliary subunit
MACYSTESLFEMENKRHLLNNITQRVDGVNMNRHLNKKVKKEMNKIIERIDNFVEEPAHGKMKVVNRLQRKLELRKKNF